MKDYKTIPEICKEIDLNNYYTIPDAKKIFLNSLKSKNKDEQYNALEGLENYYEITEDEIDDWKDEHYDKKRYGI